MKYLQLFCTTQNVKNGMFQHKEVHWSSKCFFFENKTYYTKWFHLSGALNMQNRTQNCAI